MATQVVIRIGVMQHALHDVAPLPAHLTGADERLRGQAGEDGVEDVREMQAVQNSAASAVSRSPAPTPENPSSAYAAGYTGADVLVDEEVCGRRT